MYRYHIDFGKVSEIVTSKLESHEATLKATCNKAIVIPVKKFQDRIQHEIESIQSDLTPQKELLSVQDFARLLSSFDDLPACFQKIRKPHKERDAAKMNSTICVQPKSSKESNSSMSNSVCSAPKIITEDPNSQSANETHQNYVRFKKLLEELRAELQAFAKQLQGYENDVHNLKRFAAELERLSPQVEGNERAFTPGQEEKIKQLADRLEQYIFVRSNTNLYETGSKEVAPMLQMLVESINDSLQGMSYYLSI